MRKTLIILVAGAVVGLVVAAVVVLNLDRFFGRIVLPEEGLAFAEQIKQVRAAQDWGDHAGYQPKLTREILLETRKLGCEFLYNNQKPAGNFNYQYNFVEQVQDTADNQVRQAGALWGVALCHDFKPTKRSQQVLDKGFDFFFEHTRRGPGNSLAVNYPGQKTIATGTVALVALAIVDYLRGDPPIDDQRRAELEKYLDGYLAFLQEMQLPAGDFSYGMTRGINLRVGRSSPYFDGEAQLALIKAIKYLGRTDYLPVVTKAARKTAKKYTVDAWRDDRPDSDLTKSFHQWGSMAFWDYQDAGWENADAYADTLMALGWWMIHTHRTLNRSRNTGYAFEGLIHSYRLAESQGDTAATAGLAEVIDRGLWKLTSWQVEGPLVKENRFLRKHRTQDPIAIGGIMNHSREPWLRIDVTQHQMHGIILALKHVYKKE